MHKVHVTLPDLQATVLMLHRLAFLLSAKVIALLVDNSTAKAYLCNQGGTTSPFLSRLPSEVLNLANRYDITPIPAYIPTHFNVKDDYLS